MVEGFKEITKAKGLRGLYTGYGSLIMREIPFSGLQFPLYEIFKRKSLEYTQKKELGFWQNAINGSLAGSISGFLVTPIDVIKTRQMTRSVDSADLSARNIVKSILKEEGIKGLYRGAMMRLMYLSVGGMAFFGIYEKVKSVVLKNQE